MRKQVLLFNLIILLVNQLSGQALPKITGPLGVYHTSTAYTYSDGNGTDSLLVQYQFRFGEMAFANQQTDNGLLFQQNIDSCTQWNANRIFGIIQPPSEHGVYNQPGDVSLYAPYEQANGPGMIQGGQRFSRLSQWYGGFSGVILDDFNNDTAILRQVRDAVQGKYVDQGGNVYSNSKAETPSNKLYTVIYSTAAQTKALPYLDGVSYWYIDKQNCCYTDLDNDINALRANYPGKEIMIGIYLKNTHLGWTTPESVQHMLQLSLNRYDDGDINGITLFAGPFLSKDYISLNQYSALALPHWLDSLYYPFLGEGEGTVTDCQTGAPLTGAFVNVFCKGRLSGDTLVRSRQMADAAGNYHFGLWAGNRNTDSTYYWLVAEKEGYENYTTGFWVKRNQVTHISQLPLCRDSSLVEEGELLLYPNPTNSLLTVRYQEMTGDDEVEVVDLLGGIVMRQTASGVEARLNLNRLRAGVYILRLKHHDGKSLTKKFVKL